MTGKRTGCVAGWECPVYGARRTASGSSAVWVNDRDGIGMSDQERQDLADWFRLMALMCVRNSGLEAIHAGVHPVSRTGDFSDVTVVDADGRRIPWPEVSNFGDGEMRNLMRQVVNRLYTFHAKAADPDFQCILDRWMPVARGWDAPELDEVYLSAIEARRAAGNESSSVGATKGQAS